MIHVTSLYSTNNLNSQSGTGVRSYKKGQILQHRGDLNPMLYLVRSGLLRSYHIDESGKVHIFMFASSGSIIYDPNSINTDMPSELYIDAVENSEVEKINLKKIDPNTLSSKSKDSIIATLSKSVYELQIRVIKMMSSSPYERYELFLSKYPDIASRIPQWMIASYLGITPETLSHAKGKYYRSKKSA